LNNLYNIISNNNSMQLNTKTIAVSIENYQLLKNMGKAGDSFNDVITHLVKKAGTIES
jgi:predicted CopG family antitoxin